MKKECLSFRVGYLIKQAAPWTLYYWSQFSETSEIKENRKNLDEDLNRARNFTRELDGDKQEIYFKKIDKLKNEISREGDKKRAGNKLKKLFELFEELYITLGSNLEGDSKCFYLLGSEMARSFFLVHSPVDQLPESGTELQIPKNMSKYKQFYNLFMQLQKALDKRDKKRFSMVSDQIWDTIEGYYKGDIDSEEESSPIVFISHSHSDRKVASKVDILLQKHNARTFLDEHQIEPGDPLPDRLKKGIENCNIFLLIWSRNAKHSEWVHKEWNIAYDFRKKIVPYCLDSTPLPSGLDNLVWVGYDDHKHANAKLLKAVFGKTFSLPPNQLFPGKWIAEIDAFGLAKSKAELELRANGDVIGSTKLDQGGPLSSILKGDGLGNLVNMNVPIQGSWNYEEGTQILTIEVIASGFGKEYHDVVKMKTTGLEKSIQGEDLAGRSYTLYRQ